MQLSCVCDEEKFNRYVLPNLFVDAKNSAVTGLHLVSGNLFYKQTKLDSVGIEICMAKLQRFQKPLLVCHNGKAIFLNIRQKHPNSGLNDSSGRVCRHAASFQVTFTKMNYLHV